jgi:hypothetical protein
MVRFGVRDSVGIRIRVRVRKEAGVRETHILFPGGVRVRLKLVLGSGLVVRVSGQG